MEKVTEKKVAEINNNVNVSGNETVEEIDETTQIMVVRYPFRKDQKTMHGYKAEMTTARGKVICDFEALDKGGYAVLDMVFFDKAELPLMIKSIKMKGDDGRMNTYQQYEVISEDESGVYRCQIKPKDKSDKAQLDIMLNQKAV